MAGRKKKYKTAKELEKAVNAYFDSISYREPAVVATPTGEVDEQGRVKYKTIMLHEPGKEPGVPGKPVTVTKWLSPPNMAGLRLHLSISKETWSNYGQDEELKAVVEQTRARMEDYWCTRLDGKGANGAKFALSSCYGWRERHEVGLDEPTQAAMAGQRITLEEKQEILQQIARRFGREEPEADGEDA